MACRPGCQYNNCGSYCITYGCIRLNRAARPSYTYTFASKDNPNPNAAYINSIRAALASEASARGITCSLPNTTSTAYLIDRSSSNQQMLTMLRTCLVQLINNADATIGNVKPNPDTTYADPAGVQKDNYSPGSTVYKYHYTNLADQIQNLMRDCVCHSDCGSNSWCSCYGHCNCYY